MYTKANRLENAEGLPQQSVSKLAAAGAVAAVTAVATATHGILSVLGGKISDAWGNRAEKEEEKAKA